ncbi:hypothetical protein LTR91_023479 [Friedmanniomyces endolithicus]|uniref:Uncharacterized protein n=1 Tax=Friedmanniomyces endolithicus TaxID=329885 RepID=A0AAN6JYD9_9PEZI|nr:hypothetical protein LTR94_018885 [Friedmanniomyces endolithicus]KAK0772695.1 hypothetical protein LTR59_015571 [Friedmanniomyces endolithicus]KAK0775333.1 hypothetical protein LTR38_015888 [Friedmanniomyces endolithicus]KAK0778048.1 hypothetical protein LTR75_015768 [Friedmanniomyces endolithicus]KAK0845351.1 hypothetical protein LTS02_015335 [Friedmanniomyces endolithicus]
MVLGEQTGAKLTWPAVKKLCTQSDIDRLACLAVAFINSGTVDQSIYTAAANQFGGGIKPDSYKRGLWVISKRIKDAQASGKLDGVASPLATPGKGTPKKGGKRAAGEEGDRDDEEVQTPKRVKKDGKAVKKEEVKGEVGHSVAGDDLDDYFK